MSPTHGSPPGCADVVAAAVGGAVASVAGAGGGAAAGGAAAGGAADSQGKSGPALGRLARPCGPLIQVVEPSVNAVQLSAWRQTSSPPLVRWRVSRFTS